MARKFPELRAKMGTPNGVRVSMRESKPHFPKESTARVPRLDTHTTCAHRSAPQRDGEPLALTHSVSR